MKKRVLVTGGAGYIGSILVPDLLKKDYYVTVLDNFTYNQNSLLNVCNNKNLKIINDDVRNIEVFKKLINQNDIIIPLAAIVGAPACDKDLNLSKEVNQEQIEFISESSSNDQIIIYPVTNSGYGIGQKEVMCTEETPLNPTSL